MERCEGFSGKICTFELSRVPDTLKNSFWQAEAMDSFVCECVCVGGGGGGGGGRITFIILQQDSQSAYSLNY